MLVFFTLGTLWPPGEPEEDEGEMEEPEVCAPEQAKFDWAHTWLEEEGHLHKAQGLPSQEFLVFPGFFLSYSILVFCFLCPGFWPCFRITWSFHFFMLASTVVS